MKTSSFSPAKYSQQITQFVYFPFKIVIDSISNYAKTLTQNETKHYIGTLSTKLISNFAQSLKQTTKVCQTITIMGPNSTI